MADLQNLDSSPSNGHGGTASGHLERRTKPGSEDARAGVDAALDEARSESEALAADFHRFLVAEAETAERVTELQEQLSAAVEARDLAVARAAEADARLEVTEREARQAKEEAAAEYGGRLIAARSELRDRATAKLRAKAAQLTAEHEESLVQQRGESEAARLASEQALKGRELEIETELAARETEIEAKLAQRKAKIEDEIAAGTQEATKRAEAEREGREAAERRQAQLESQLEEVVELLSNEVAARIRREATRRLEAETERLQAKARKEASKAREIAVRAAEQDFLKRAAMDERTILHESHKREEAEREKTESEVQEAIALIRRELLD